MEGVGAQQEKLRPHIQAEASFSVFLTGCLDPERRRIPAWSRRVPRSWAAHLEEQRQTQRWKGASAGERQTCC